MIFTETKLKGSFLIDLEKLKDERGFFARSWCKKEFENCGIHLDVVQSNISYNKQKGTLRGMHYQTSPHGEAKVVCCTNGAIYDVIIDLRKDSATFKQWLGVELSRKNYQMIYIPEDFAHGFLTLVDDTEVSYQMSEFYYPDYAKGIRWNDPEFAIQWPGEVKLISDRDGSYPDVEF